MSPTVVSSRSVASTPVGALVPWPLPATQVRVPTEDPALVAAAVAVAFGVAVAGYGLYRLVSYLRRPQGVRFVEAVDGLDSVDVVMHPNPDPDAMAAAMGLATIAEAEGVSTTLCYPGEIRHQENRAFQTVLDLALDHVETSSDLDGEAVVLVDHNEPRGFAGAESIDPLAVVDHHPGDGEGTAHTDVRTDYGACATIVAEYLADLGATVLAPGEPVPETELALSPELATGLLYGIQADTNRLVNGVSRAEFEACEYLFGGVDEDALDRIANPQVDAETLAVKATAIREREVEPPYAVADVADVDNVDAIPQAADELVRLEGVSSVVVYGEADGTIHLSGRSRDDRVHMGNVLAAAVDEIPMAGAGGHARMGGGQVPREHMEGIGPQTGVGKTRLKSRLFEAMRGEL
jgi:nanoRNase/pAp phosphatase (c-di-AMP/oligoRNAs hydrolase)